MTYHTIIAGPTKSLIEIRAKMRRRERATNRLIDTKQMFVKQLREDRFAIEAELNKRGVHIYSPRYTRKST